MSVRRRLPIGRRPSIGMMWLRTWLTYIARVLGRHCWPGSQRGAYSASVVLPSAGVMPSPSKACARARASAVTARARVSKRWRTIRPSTR
jgi:hypothetical protein